ncbi:MAG TPA: MlaD family protein [Candidatus Methylomirabilis sp.]|nr:MlaD family protein [Candidatus Methylomirabilis sp.]
MTERQMQLRIGALVLVAIGLFMTFVLSIGQRSALFQQRYSLWTSFSSTEGLAVGAPVRLAGLTVGNVTRVSFGGDPKDRRIAITLTVERRVQDRIREDSVASIGTIGLVGDKVLEITVGSYDKPELPPGAKLASVDPLDYSVLLQKGDRILDHVTRVSASLDEYLAGGEEAGKRNLNDALRSLRTSLVEVEQGQGLLHDLIYGKEGANLLGRVDRTVQSLERTAQAIETERGLLYALIHSPADESLGKLNRAVANLDDLLREAKEGQGLLHTLVYGTEGTELLARLDGASRELEGLVRGAREGPGLIPSLFFDPAGRKTLEDLQAAAAAARAAAADLQAVMVKLRQGGGTLGALLEDPTLYEDLSALLRGANRSTLLRSLIRSTRDEGLPEKKK